MADDQLQTYREKRDFSRTPEPDGSASASKGSGNSFVIQKHDATRLHYDFRLELDGVLKSWAVTKGPSLNPSDKRLAVRTEDHPLDYGSFEGVIPDGYGKGTVMLWDQGTWEPQDDPHEGLKKGSLKFTLNGQRLTGGFALVRMKSKKKSDRENWLLIKERDDHIDEDNDPRDIWTDSVTSGRDFKEIEIAAASGDAGIHGEDADQELPDFVKPQLASLRDSPPTGDDWVHEMKFDGYRIQALVSGPRVKLISRNGKDYTDKYPGIVRALSGLNLPKAILDGELVALDDEGHSNFSLLQAATKKGADADLAYFAFDLLHKNGKDLRKKPLLERKSMLKNLLDEDSHKLRYSDHIDGDGERIVGKACAMGMEGIISKKADGKYTSDRGTQWIKSKCLGRDEFIIAGYRESDKRGRPFASLLLGEYEDGKLIYRGRVGTGFDEETLSDLSAKFKSLTRKTSPFNTLPSDAKRRAVWLTPKLVCEIEYTEQTPDGHLRHPSYLGLRDDKAAEDVISQAEKADMVEANKPAEDNETRIGGITISNADRVVFDEQGVTKGDIAAYLNEVAEHMLPHIKDRPVSLVRCPAGDTSKCFFQKHHTDSTPDDIGSVMIRESDGEEDEYLVLNSAKALVSAAQIGALELHIWGARTDKLESPDRFVMDLDPDESLSFEDVQSAAFEVRDVLESAGLKSFPLLTGGKGIHVIVPLERRRDWDEIKTAARNLAQKLADAAPGSYVAEMSKKKRKGKIFLDWLRNERGATAIAPYSLRARPGAPVATPVDWAELKRIEAADKYTIRTIGQRLAQLKSDPWEGYFDVRQSISKHVMEVLSESL
tara:strand:- start:25729 stop:28215 length:2487 start_codon:yes stop_codon:yes gene_type:complete